jgi:thiosulfate/3-mercaptopyruvate sulfurtransferase
MEDLPVPFVSPAWLLAHLGDPDLRILDARWSLAGGAGSEEYRQGHVPHALFIDLDHELASPPGPGGRHPLPDPERFSAAMRERGVGAQSRVVVYDQATGAAARAWWLLRAAGHPLVSVLDGGLGAYLEVGGALTAEIDQLAPGDFAAGGFQGWLPADEIAPAQAGGAVVLDARSRDRFRGDPNPLDPRPGHLPGARSLPWTELYEDGRVRGRGEVLERLAAAHDQTGPVVAYCGSGVTACALLLALNSAGFDTGRLYPGSWSEWGGDHSRPAETGE